MSLSVLSSRVPKRVNNSRLSQVDKRSVNHAVSSAMAAGLSMEPNELVLPALVVGVSLRIAGEPTRN